MQAKQEERQEGFPNFFAAQPSPVHQSSLALALTSPALPTLPGNQPGTGTSHSTHTCAPSAQHKRAQQVSTNSTHTHKTMPHTHAHTCGLPSGSGIGGHAPTQHIRGPWSSRGVRNRTAGATGSRRPASGEAARTLLIRGYTLKHGCNGCNNSVAKCGWRPVPPCSDAAHAHAEHPCMHARVHMHVSAGRNEHLVAVGWQGLSLSSLSRPAHSTRPPMPCHRAHESPNLWCPAMSWRAAKGSRL